MGYFADEIRVVLHGKWLGRGSQVIVLYNPLIVELAHKFPVGNVALIDQSAVRAFQDGQRAVTQAIANRIRVSTVII
jgi:hypothetical protein